MTVESAFEQLSKIGEDRRGYCLPLALDSVMRYTVLPVEYYTYFKAQADNPESNYNANISILLKDFFGVTPQPAIIFANIGKYNAFGQSPQPYIPEIEQIDLDGTDRKILKSGATEKHLRLRNVLRAAAKGNCSVLVCVQNAGGEHVLGLEKIDPGFDNQRTGLDHHSAKYVLRDFAELADNRAYTIPELAGLTALYSGNVQKFGPLPEVSRDYYPGGKTSWDLIILPSGDRPLTK